MGKVVVLTEFADKDNFAKRYKVGEELTGFSEERIANLVARGIAGSEKARKQEGGKAEGEKAGSGKAEGEKEESPK
jgi:hypothetical protein